MPLRKDDISFTLLQIRLGIAAGLASCLVYPAMIFLHLPYAGIVVLAAVLGPLLGVAGLGLGKLLRIPRRSVSAKMAAVFTFTGGALMTAMLLVQLAVKVRAGSSGASSELIGVWLGLDVALDVYLGLGTGLFALAMLRHPRFGPWLGIPGLPIAAGLLVLNLYTFPTPPADAGLVDLGPLVGLWFLAAAVQAWRSLRWAETTLAREILGDKAAGAPDAGSAAQGN